MASSTFNPAIKTVVDEMLTMPGIKAGSAFGYPAYKINGKVFAFVGEKGLMLKLPAGRIQSALEQHPSASILEVQPGVFWREWLHFQDENPQDLRHYLGLVEESLAYVGQAK
jgi:hypothetical protein